VLIAISLPARSTGGQARRPSRKLLHVVTARVEAHRRGPVGEDADNADISRQHIDDFHDIALARDRIVDRLVVEAVAAVGQDAGTLERPRDDVEADLFLSARART